MTALTLPSTGAAVAVDLISAENHQLMKMEYGAAGSATQVSAASPLPTTTPDITASGTLSAAAQLVNLPLNGQSSANIQITGTWTGTIQFEGTTGGVTFDPINGVFSSSSVPAPTATVNGTYRITPGALASIQARMSVFGSGSATIAIRASAGTGGTFANQVLPIKVTDGTNTVGITSAAIGGNESTTDRFKVNASLRVIDTAQAAGSQLVGARGDQTTGIWVNIKNATIPVTGSFFQATQPVSGAFFQTTQPVSGTFFQTTQPVSMATNTPDVTDRVGRLLGQVTNAGTFAVQAAATLAAETTKIIGTVNVAAAQSIASTQATAANLNMTATPIALTKGTQGATGFTTQDLKDAGRNLVCYYTLIPVLTTVTDTLQSLTGTKGGATVAATTTPAVVTTGKNFRVSSITATYIATAVSGYALVRVRAQPAGDASLTSPVVATFAVGSSAPGTANAVDCVMEDFPDGSEFAAGVGIGISVQGLAGVTATAVGYVMVSINGYEY